MTENIPIFVLVNFMWEREIGEQSRIYREKTGKWNKKGMEL